MPGSGLGLAIVRQAAEAGGGGVVAANAPDGAVVRRRFAPQAPTRPSSRQRHTAGRQLARPARLGTMPLHSSREEFGVKIIVLGSGRRRRLQRLLPRARTGTRSVVVDREGEVGQDASAGNAGLIAPGHSYAWASPAAPKLMLGSLAGKKTSIRVKPRLDPDLVPGASGSCGECTADRARRNTLVKHRLCRFSHGLIKSIAATESIDYAAEEAGMFYLYADEAELEAGFQKTALLRENGEDLQLLDAAGVDRARAGAGPPARPHGRRHLRRHRCQRRLRRSSRRASPSAAARSASTSSWAAPSTASASPAARSRPCRPRNGDIVGDGYVLACGVGSAGIARSVGLRVPVYPAKGYSATFPVREDGECRASAASTRTRWSPGRGSATSLRMSSTAQFAGYDRSWTMADFAGVLETARRPVPDRRALRPAASTAPACGR